MSSAVFRFPLMVVTSPVFRFSCMFKYAKVLSKIHRILTQKKLKSRIAQEALCIPLLLKAFPMAFQLHIE